MTLLTTKFVTKEGSYHSKYITYHRLQQPTKKVFYVEKENSTSRLLSIDTGFPFTEYYYRDGKLHSLSKDLGY